MFVLVISRELGRIYLCGSMPILVSIAAMGVGLVEELFILTVIVALLLYSNIELLDLTHPKY